MKTLLTTIIRMMVVFASVSRGASSATEACLGPASETPEITGSGTAQELPTIDEESVLCVEFGDGQGIAGMDKLNIHFVNPNGPLPISCTEANRKRAKEIIVKGYPLRDVLELLFPEQRFDQALVGGRRIVIRGEAFLPQLAGAVVDGVLLLTLFRVDFPVTFVVTDADMQGRIPDHEVVSDNFENVCIAPYKLEGESLMLPNGQSIELPEDIRRLERRTLVVKRNGETVAATAFGTDNYDEDQALRNFFYHNELVFLVIWPQ